MRMGTLRHFHSAGGRRGVRSPLTNGVHLAAGTLTGQGIRGRRRGGYSRIHEGRYPRREVIQ